MSPAIGSGLQPEYAERRHSGLTLRALGVATFLAWVAGEWMRHAGLIGHAVQLGESVLVIPFIPAEFHGQATPWETDEWHHVALTWHCQRGIWLYCDGVEMNSSSTTGLYRKRRSSSTGPERRSNGPRWPTRSPTRGRWRPW